MLRHTEVDGVPTLLAPGSGPMVAGLTFRVGRVDEGLARTGITHLVEHLALHRHGVADHHNGVTGGIVTHFHLRGAEADIVRSLELVCDSLSDLPVERLETEKAILRAEAAGRADGVTALLPLWRYGAQHFGLVSYPEWGVDQLSADDVRAWAHTWFTRENAVLWISGDRVPAGLRLRLPGGGRRRPVPPAATVLPSTPAYFAGPNGGVVFDGLMRRHTAGTLFGGMLERELLRALRQEGGLSTTASASYDPRGDGFAVVTAFADAPPERQDAVLGGFVDVLAGFRVGRIEQADLDAVRAKREEALAHPDVHAGRLSGLATDLLTGEPVLSVDELHAELRAVTLDGIHDAALQVTGSGLLQVPPGHRADWAGFTAAPATSSETIPGYTFRSVDGSGAALVLGAEGVSLVEGERRVTVRFRTCAAVHAWPDGARQLIGLDGITVRIEPTLFAAPPDTAARIDAAVDPALVVRMPARTPDAIPRPYTPAQPPPTRLFPAASPDPNLVLVPGAQQGLPQPLIQPQDPAAFPAGRFAARPGRTRPGTAQLIIMIAMFAAGLVFLSCAGVLTIASVEGIEPGEEEFRDVAWYVIVTIAWTGTLTLLGWAGYLLVRRLRS
ncbi:insulinase family protein [Dactylosporangium siamense]|uniref:Insulinase family protein n=1 Tax=Dactylosporangium siamense TaxID=685454 RepID=A0A919PF79_9ACTN|nr:insulinase family protein [Dactylosporangium siamense]GIG42287.1 hypothetical protein Dsi01nite_003280 [Dactylosporangium siamense]